MSKLGRGLEAVLRDHPFFGGLAEEQLVLLAGCGKNERFDEGRFLFREGGAADQFYIIRQGRVRVEVHSTRRGPLMLETLGEGDVLGWSWLVPPYRWRFDARALELTRVVAMDGTCLRGKCEEDPALGYELLKRFAQVLADRLEAARMQMMDMYADPAKAGKGKAGG